MKKIFIFLFLFLGSLNNVSAEPMRIVSGNEKAKIFLNSELIIIKQFITHYGFSYGYGDLEVPEKDREAIKDDTQSTYDEIHDLISQERKEL